MSRKYVFPPHHEVSADQDPNLTIEDVATKSEILKKIQCNLLPAIKGHIISLLKALYDLDKEYPHPDIDLTLGILSDLDQTLQTTTSSILTLADESPLPHAKHDHRMEKLKIYRCLELRWKIKHPASAWEQASQSRQTIPMMTIDVLESINDTIAWCLKSDWAIVRRNWLISLCSLDKHIGDLTKQAHASLGSTSDLARLTMSLTEDHDQVEQALLQTRRTEAIERSVELASSTIPLVKINSETLGQLHAAFGSMTAPIMSIVCHVRIVQSSTHFTMADARRNVVLSLKNELMTTLETTSTNIASRLMPLLHGTEHTSPASDFKAWSLTLEQPWDKVVDHLSDLVSSFEVEPAE
ncbi:hypothetical protein, variant [Puccinia striiformis f. sp. tritici PST-78]|nr:hypothetical protein, variant [Puccinia striiformis f. sp. tritici PST-78]